MGSVAFEVFLDIRLNLRDFESMLNADLNSEKNQKKLTPLMTQYWEIKDQHPDEILLFRMGDFYELFSEDAVKAAPVTGLTLTARNKKSGDTTPMCGFPHHSLSSPIQKLLEAGFRVAICDQVEDPADAKGLVKRAVTRRLSPGMVFDPDTLDQRTGHYMMAIDEQKISFLDATTAEAFTYTNDKDYDYFFEALNVVEVIFADKKDFKNFKFPPHICLSLFESGQNEKAPIKNAEQLLISYVKQTQGDTFLQTFDGFKPVQKESFLKISSKVFKHLEVFKDYEGESKGSLFSAVNKTLTPAGSRKLKSWLRNPLVDEVKIKERHDSVELWTKDYFKLKALREILKDLGDLERRTLKISSPSCGPKDMQRLEDSLQILLNLSTLIPLDSSNIQAVEKTRHLLGRAFKDEVPVQVAGGQFIKRGFAPELDEVIELSDNAQDLIQKMENQEKEKTGVSTLKIRYNNVFGFYIEVTKVHAHKMPAHYIRKQTLTNSERYTTEELQVLEEKVLSAKTKKIELEIQAFKQIRDEILKESRSFLQLCDQVSDVDVLSSFAWLSLERKYSKPQINISGVLDLKKSRHPVVEQSPNLNFVANDIFMNPGECILITGPNMAGKSTVMRQVALCVILNQVGCFVPATSASLPIYENLYTRIGSSDFLSQGLSTFMVEMSETAELLKDANSKSLIILDEIGRGTSTYDGLSLAQAILEELLNKNSTFMFSTHYQELTLLENDFAHLKNMHMSAKKNEQQILFEYVLTKGPALKSYGIEVAKLAGVPDSVIQRAESLLNNYESDLSGLNSSSSDLQKLSEQKTTQPQFDLFNFKPAQKIKENIKNEIDPKILKLIQQVKEFSINQGSPLQALNEIAKWQKDL